MSFHVEQGQTTASLSFGTDVPTDLTWDEFCSVLAGFGFECRSAGGGSSRTFVHAKKGLTVVAHQPHPCNIVKPYAIRNAVALLRKGGLL